MKFYWINMSGKGTDKRKKKGNDDEEEMGGSDRQGETYGGFQLWTGLKGSYKAGSRGKTLVWGYSKRAIESQTDRYIAFVCVRVMYNIRNVYNIYVNHICIYALVFVKTHARGAVSYTHLDVYKRQIKLKPRLFFFFFNIPENDMCVWQWTCFPVN